MPVFLWEARTRLGEARGGEMDLLENCPIPAVAMQGHDAACF